MDNNRKNQLLATIATLLICLVVGLALVFTGLHYEYPPKGEEIKLRQDSILFGGEFVMLGNMPDVNETEELDTDTPAPTENVTDQPDVEGDDLEDAGEPAPKPAPKPLVTAKNESPMKVKEKPKPDEKTKTGPATSKKPDDKQEKVKRGQEDATRNRVADAFGKSAGKNSGKQGSPDGNASQGATAGRPGIAGLEGYTLEYWGRPHSRWTGSVTVRVRVNARGKVIEAHAVSGTGEAWAHGEVRKSCESESLKSAFSVPKKTTQEGVGTITWRFI